MASLTKAKISEDAYFTRASLRIPDARFEELSQIPGLRVTSEGLAGSRDAVEAGLRLLGVKEQALLNPVSVSVDQKLGASFGLRPYQAEGVGTIIARLTKNGGTILGDEMGLGKTRQAIVASFLLGIGPRLILCPAAVREQWADEIQSTLSRHEKATSIAVLRPRTTKRDEREWLQSETADWVISSYDLADNAITHAFSCRYPEVLILDEAHLLKGRKTERSSLVDNIAQTARYRLALSGTPVPDRIRDLWRLLDIIVPRTFGKSYDFDLRYARGSHRKHGFDNRGATNLEELHRRLSYHLLMRQKRDVAKDLPPLTHTVQWVPGTDAARRAFENAMLSKDSQATYRALHAALEDKIPYAVDLALSAERFILFTFEKAHAVEIARRISKVRPCELLTGDQTSEERKRRIASAVEHKRGVVATIDSTGTGVNMQKVASHVIFHAIDYQPKKTAQAVARAHRIGQTDAVTATFIAMRDSMDEPVVRLNVQKLDALYSAVKDDRGHRDAFDDFVDAKGSNEDLKALFDSLSENESEIDSED